MAMGGLISKTDCWAGCLPMARRVPASHRRALSHRAPGGVNPLHVRTELANRHRESEEMLEMLPEMAIAHVDEGAQHPPG
jgi:hypothetical protein